MNIESYQFQYILVYLAQTRPPYLFTLYYLSFQISWSLERKKIIASIKERRNSIVEKFCFFFFFAGQFFSIILFLMKLCSCLTYQHISVSQLAKPQLSCSRRIGDSEDFRQQFRLEIRLNAFRRSTMLQNNSNFYRIGAFVIHGSIMQCNLVFEKIPVASLSKQEEKIAV